MYRNTILMIAALMSSVLWAGCGGGGGGTGNLPQKSAEVTFSTTSTDPAVQISGIFIAVTLPAGVTVATDPGSNQISASSLQGVGVQAFGSYSAPIRKVKIATLPGTISLGAYARLNCAVQQGFTFIDPASIITLDFEPTGPGGSTLNNVQSSISVIPGY